VLTGNIVLNVEWYLRIMARQLQDDRGVWPRFYWIQPQYDEALQNVVLEQARKTQRGRV